MSRGISRRRLLEVGGATGLASLSGCLSSEMVVGSMDDPGMPFSRLPGTFLKGEPKTGEYPANEGDKPVEVLLIAPEDQSHNYHFFPHVAWVEPGTTVKWHHTKKKFSEKAVHTATAFDGSRYVRLIPEDAASFDSGFVPGTGGGHPHEQILVDEGPFTHTFEERGVYLYYCQDHHYFGMAGAIVVGPQWKNNKGPGWSPGMTADLSPVADIDEVGGKHLMKKLEKIRKFVRMGGMKGEKP